jgi:hypothetical protein
MHWAVSSVQPKEAEVLEWEEKVVKLYRTTAPKTIGVP